MEKFINRVLWVLLILFTLCFGVYFVVTQSRTDRTAPKISFASDAISVSVNDDSSALLAGVSAYDQQDGDVTASVLIETISAIDSDNCATVTYAAFDQAGNVAKAQRVVSYLDYEGPKFSLVDSLTFRTGQNFNLFKYITATDPVDGDISDRIKATLVSGTSSINELGLHQVELRVTNSMGDVAKLTVPVEVYSATAYNATVVLSDYLIYLKQGDSFLPRQYLESIDTGYQQHLISEYSDVDIVSNVQTDVCGVYTVTYTVQHENYTGYSRLVVVVEE